MSKQFKKVIAAGLASLTMFSCTLVLAHETSSCSTPVTVNINGEEFQFLSFEDFKELTKEKKIEYFGEKSSEFDEVENYLRNCNHPLCEEMGKFSADMENKVNKNITKFLISEYRKLTGRDAWDDLKLDYVADLISYNTFESIGEYKSEFESPPFDVFVCYFINDPNLDLRNFIEEEGLNEFYKMILECAKFVISEEFELLTLEEFKKFSKKEKIAYLDEMESAFGSARMRRLCVHNHQIYEMLFEFAQNAVANNIPEEMMFDFAEEEKLDKYYELLSEYALMGER